MLLATLYIRDIREEGRVDFDGIGTAAQRRVALLPDVRPGDWRPAGSRRRLAVTAAIVATGLGCGWLYI